MNASSTCDSVRCSGARLGSRRIVLAVGSCLACACTGPTASAPTLVASSAARPLGAPGRDSCAPARATGEAPLIDDFEAGPRRILANEGRGGWWFSYDDGTGGKLLMEEVDVAGDRGKGRALHVVGSDFKKWGCGFGASLHPAATATHGCAYDASAYSGIRIRARGRGRGRLRMTLGDANSMPAALGGSCTRPADRCYDSPGVWLDLEEQYKTYVYPFCAFVPEGWGGSTEKLDPSKLFAIRFRIGDREHVEAWLDDLAFYRAASDASSRHCGLPCPLDAVPHSARIEPLFSTAPLGEELSVHTFEQPTTSCGPLTRRYLSYVPSSLGARSSAPVLIMLHGSGGNAESARTFLAHDRFDALAARDGFIAVYGNAAPGSDTSPDPEFPNTGVWRQAFFDDGQVDDVDYLERVLADLASRGVIQGDNPVLLTGISNGGGMVLQAARRIPDRFRGIAALMPFDGLQPKPVPDVSATRLERVLFAYSIGDPGMSPGYHETLALQPARWAAALGIGAADIAKAHETELPNRVVEGEGYRGSSAEALSTRNSHVTELDIAATNGRARVRVLVFEHAGHFWPNPQGDTEDWVLAHWGFRNQDLDAADTVWEFLRGAVIPE